MHGGRVRKIISICLLFCLMITMVTYGEKKSDNEWDIVLKKGVWDTESQTLIVSDSIYSSEWIQFPCEVTFECPDEYEYQILYRYEDGSSGYTAEWKTGQGHCSSYEEFPVDCCFQVRRKDAIVTDLDSITVTFYGDFSKNDLIEGDSDAKKKAEQGFQELEKRIDDSVTDYIEENGYKIDGQKKTYGEIEAYVKESSFADYNGKLRKEGTRVVNQYGDPIQLYGVNLYHIPTLFGRVHTYETLKTLKMYGFNLVRLPVYVAYRISAPDDPYDPNCTGYDTNSDEIKKDMDQLLEWCEELGIYAIVDFHNLGHQHIEDYWNEAREFFTYFSTKYANSDIVLYELLNEPYEQKAEELEAYLKEMSTLIRENAGNPVIMTGHGADGFEAMAKMILKDDLDIFATEHVYVANVSDTSWFSYYLSMEYPLFISEWGNSDWEATYGTYNNENTEAMLNLFLENKIPHAIFQFSPCRHSTSLLQYDTQKNDFYKYGGFTEEDMSDGGKIFFEYAFLSTYKKEYEQ